MAGQEGINISGKTQILGRLYTLRAGLSLISQEKEKADVLMDDADRHTHRVLSQADERIENAKTAITKENEQLNKITKEINLLRNKTKIIKILSQSVLLFILVAISLAALYLLFVGGAQLILHGIIYEPKEKLPGLWETLVGWLPFGWFFLAIIGGIVGCGPMGGYIYYSYENDSWLVGRIKARKSIAALEERRLYQQQAIKKAYLDLEHEENKKKKDIVEVDKYCVDALEKATGHAVAGLAIIQGLTDTFSDIIDARDWENVDIIIYAIETRRAENIKEALGVVDGERRTERIVNAINEAGQEICKSISMGLNRLQNEMTRCFGLLSDQITRQTMIMANEMSGIRRGIAANNTYIAELTSQASMNNALLAQANKNSATLASDVTSLRTAAEYSVARSLYHGA